jgi:hypothetical protein
MSLAQASTCDGRALALRFGVHVPLYSPSPGLPPRWSVGRRFLAQYRNIGLPTKPRMRGRY